MATDLARLGIVVDSTDIRMATARMQTMGATAQRIGGMMTAFITTPLLGAATAAGKFSSDIQDSLAQAQAQADLTGQQISTIGDSAEETAIRTGQSTDEIIEAYKFTTSAGLDVAESQELVGAAAEASAAGFGTQRDLVRLTTTALQAYDDQLDSSREFMDLLVGSAQEMELEVSKLGPAVQRNVGVAKELGIELDQLMAGIGSVSEIMGDAQRGGRMFQTMLSKLLKPSAQGEAAISEMFGSLEDLHASIREDGLLDTMVELRQRLEEAGMGFESVFTGQRGLEAALNFTNREGERTNEILDGTTDTAGALKEAFEESATVSRLLARAWEALKATMRPFGNTILDTMRPALVSLIESAKEAADTFSGWSDETRRTVLEIAGLIGAGGPILLAIGTLTTAFAAISWPVILGVSAFAGAVGVITQNWDSIVAYFTTGEGAEMWQTIKEETKELWEQLRDTFQAGVTFIRKFWGEFGEDIIETTEEAFGRTSEIIGGVLEGLEITLYAFSGEWSKAWDVIMEQTEERARDARKEVLSALTFGASDLVMSITPKAEVVDTEEVGEPFRWSDLWADEPEEEVQRGMGVIRTEFTKGEETVESFWSTMVGNVEVEQMLADVQSLMEFLRMDFGGGDMKATVVDTSFDSIEVSASDAKDEVDELSDSIGDMPEERELGGIEAAEGSIADLQMRMQAFQNMRELVDPKSEAFDSLTQSITDTREEMNQLTGETEQQSEAARQLGFTFTSAFEDAIIEGKAFSDVLQGIFQDIQRIILRTQITEPLAEDLGGVLDGLFSSSGGVSADDQGNLFSIDALFGRASGGPVVAGNRYMVGEEGPEVFEPSTGGTIVPNHKMKSSASNKSDDSKVENNIQIINNSGQEVETQERRNASGGMDVDVIIGEKMKQMHNSGQMDSTLRRNFGINRKGRT